MSGSLLFLFICLFLVVRGLRCLLSFSLVVFSGVYVLVAIPGLLTGGFSCCGAQALGRKAQQLQHVGSLGVENWLSGSAA